MSNKSKPRLGIIALNPGVPRLLGLVDDGAIGGQAVGGIEVQVVALARALVERGWDVTFLTGDSGQPETATTTDGMKVIRAYHGAYATLRRTAELSRNLATLPVDVCLLQGIHGAAGLASLLGHATGKRFVFWLASNTDATCTDPKTSRLSPSQRRMAAYGLRTADALVAQTEYQAQLLRERLGRDSTVIPNLWPVDSLKPGQADAPTALWVANLRWEKRPEMFIDVAEATPEMSFVMVGGPMKDNQDLYERVLAREKEVPNFKYVGFVPFGEVGQWFERSTIFVNTSVVEGFPNTFLQAWDAKLPIVASFDPDGVLTRKQLGYHCENVPQFADRLRELSADQQQCRFLGERGKGYLRDNFSPEVVLPKLESLLTQVAAEGRIG
ncbi:MAG: glycosyltransferase family 4 protein [Armatimonadota bacterium]